MGVGARARAEHEWSSREAEGVRPGLPCCFAALTTPIAPALSARASQAGGRAAGLRAALALRSHSERAAEPRRRGRAASSVPLLLRHEGPNEASLSVRSASKDF